MICPECGKKMKPWDLEYQFIWECEDCGILEREKKDPSTGFLVIESQSINGVQKHE